LEPAEPPVLEPLEVQVLEPAEPPVLEPPAARVLLTSMPVLVLTPPQLRRAFAPV
jgi:hypothetical protein